MRFDLALNIILTPVLCTKVYLYKYEFLIRINSNKQPIKTNKSKLIQINLYISNKFVHMDYLNEYHKECPNCGEEYEARRLNQKFCTMKCKARYNNRKAKEVNIKQKNIESITGATNRILWRNRQILFENIEGFANLNDLKEAGFKLNYITKFEQTSNQKNRFFCYDMAYEFNNKETIKIFQS